MPPTVAASGLRFAYGDIVALSGLDLEIPSGLIGLVGANGAGKTTLLKLLLGILSPAAGKVEVLGRPMPERTLEVRSRVGYMPEGPCLPPDQTASDFLIYAAELGGLPLRAARQRASDVLTIVGLHEERFRPLGGFSTGMQQRAKLAQAIVHDPELVLLDEPTAGLDPEGREEMLDLITRLDDFGINAVVSSHVLPDIERTCTWVVMLDGGKVLRSGPLTDLSTTESVHLEVLDDRDRVAAALEASGAVVTPDGNGLLVTLADGDPSGLVRDVLADTGVGIRRMGPRRITLEDVYLAGGGGQGGEDA
ncbi:MAG: ABC transporter ATP-binding protein [Actinobacteria bacterium]|nr:ABC transporter ATP-binding protein [Actinomycetota bacterium]